MDHKTSDEDHKLLNDADFLRLMEAEYQNSQVLVNELEKKQTWAAIQKKISSKTSFHRGWLLVAAALLAFIPFVKLRQQDDLGIKGRGPEADVALSIQSLNAEGRPEMIEELKTGQTLIFKVSSSTASYLALVLQIDAGQPVVQFQVEAPWMGQDQILAVDGQAFVYQVDQSGQTLKFCLLTATNREDLQQKMANLTQHWPEIGAKHCQTLVVP